MLNYVLPLPVDQKRSLPTVPACLVTQWGFVWEHKPSPGSCKGRPRHGRAAEGAGLLVVTPGPFPETANMKKQGGDLFTSMCDAYIIMEIPSSKGCHFWLSNRTTQLVQSALKFT